MKIRTVVLLCLACACGVASADEVADWNAMLLQAMLTAPVTAAPVATRVGAIVHAAMFDAVNGVDGNYTPVYVRPAASPGASKRAAIVQAAYASLLSLYPAQKDKFDQQRAASLAAIPDPPDAVQQGITWGQYVADQIMAWRSQDGFSKVPAAYMGGTGPGQWRPTPPAMAAGLVPQLATTAPWVIRSPSQFRGTGPAALTSDQYTADFNETKTMGGAAGSARTADQTLLANFWQAGNPPDYWDPLTLDLASRNNYSLVKTARLIALVNMAMADAIIGCWDGKYNYSSWRPVTAIQLGDTDSNNATAADANWTPLVTTPPFPEYPSAHSCATGAALRILSRTFGEDVDFTIGSNAMPGVQRSFHNFTAALQEVMNARILGGIHLRTACVDGTALGISVAEFVMSRALIPLAPESADQDPEQAKAVR